MTIMTPVLIFTVLTFIPKLYANEDFPAGGRQLPQIVLDELARRRDPSHMKATLAPPINFEVLIENSQRQMNGLPPMSPGESTAFLENKKGHDEMMKKSKDLAKLALRQIEESDRMMNIIEEAAKEFEFQSEQDLQREAEIKLQNARREEARIQAEKNSKKREELKSSSHYISIDRFVQGGQVTEAAKYFASNDCLQETLAVIEHYKDGPPSAVRSESMPVLLVLMGGALLENKTVEALQSFDAAIRSYENPATVFAIGILINKAGTVSKLYSKLESSISTLESQDFWQIRWALMRAFLWSTGWSTSELEESMTSKVMKKDSDGFTDFKHTELNLSGDIFHSVDGISLDLTNGNFELKTTPAGELQGLITHDDAFEILSKGIQSSIFSLDPSFPGMQFHPFQRMRFSPSQIEGTDYLATLFQADYLLKAIALGTESSNKEPFNVKDITPALKALLPEHIFQELEYKPFQVLSQNKTMNYRFWIEAGNIPLAVEKTETRISFTFGYVSMYVHRKQQILDPITGELSDVEEYEAAETDECNDSFCSFALAFTKYYDEIGYHLPIFARLRELLKMSAISSLLTRSNLLKEGLTEHQVTLFQKKFAEEGYAPETEIGDSIMVTSDYWVPTLFRRDLEMHKIDDLHVNVTANAFSYGGISLTVALENLRQEIVWQEWKWKQENFLLEMKTQSLERELDSKLQELEREEFGKEQEERWQQIRLEQAEHEDKEKEKLEREKQRQEAEEEKIRQAEKSRQLKEEREIQRKQREIERESDWLSRFGDAVVKPGLTFAIFRKGRRGGIPLPKASPQPTPSPSSKQPPPEAPKPPPPTPKVLEATKKLKLPDKGEVRFEPPTDKSGREILKRVNKDGRSQESGFEDKYGNKWFKGPSRTKDEPFEWDVELSRQGLRKYGGSLKPGQKHLNVSLEGNITH